VILAKEHMATKQQLIARWETPEGQQIVEDLYRTLQQALQ
jgi:hypothetical protein